MELQTVRYFLALAQSLNFTRAAEHCSVTQPALTKAIQKLEHELGGALIYRERNRTQLTELGKLVLPGLQRTVAAADAVKIHAKQYGDRTLAPLRIALSASIAASLVTDAIHKISEYVPGVQVELLDASPEVVPTLLMEGSVNAAIGDDSIPDDFERLDRWTLFEERLMIAVASNGRHGDAIELSMSDLAGASWIEPIGCSVAAAFWRTHFPEPKSPKIAHRGRQYEHLQHMVAAGLGILLVPEHMPAVAGTLSLPIEGDPARRSVQLLMVSGRQYSPAQDALVKVARTFNWRQKVQKSAGRARCPPRGETRVSVV
jgi:DNA-binding transcriptional LysR family regulator